MLVSFMQAVVACNATAESLHFSAFHYISAH